MRFNKKLFEEQELRNFWFKNEFVIFLVSILFIFELISPLLDDLNFWWMGWLSLEEFAVVILLKVAIYIPISFLLAFTYSTKRVVKSKDKSIWLNMKWPVILSIVAIISFFLLFTDSVNWHSRDLYKEHEFVILSRRFKFFTKELGLRLFLSTLSGVVFYLIVWFWRLKVILKMKDL